MMHIRHAVASQEKFKESRAVIPNCKVGDYVDHMYLIIFKTNLVFYNACSSFQNCLDRVLLLIRNLLKKRFIVVNVRSSFQKF